MSQPTESPSFFYSTILTDIDQTTVSPNVLFDDTTLQLLKNNFASILLHSSLAEPGPGNGTLRRFKNNQTRKSGDFVLRYLDKVSLPGPTPGTDGVPYQIHHHCRPRFCATAVQGFPPLFQNTWLTQTHADGKLSAFAPLSLRIFFEERATETFGCESELLCGMGSKA